MQDLLFPDDTPDITQPGGAMPDGFRYRTDMLSPEEEAAVVAEIERFDFQPYMFRGFAANRRVVAFGFRYDYSTRRMVAAPAMPCFLAELRERIGRFADTPPEAFRQLLVTQYRPGTALAWHRDRLQYGKIAGLSLCSAASLRFRRRAGERWERASRVVEPRSVYVMAGDVRMNWEHSLPAVPELRYSLTFRTFAETFTPPAEKPEDSSSRAR